MTEILPVLFRRPRSKALFENDGVTAVFPTLGWSSEYDMTCYAHVGQYGACDMGWYYTTRPATPVEYASLLAELRGIYSDPNDPDAVDLVVRSRMPYNAVALRRANMSPPTQARALARRVAGLSAWNHTPEEVASIVRARRNGYGVRLTFADGSAAFLPRGTADVRVVA